MTVDALGVIRRCGTAMIGVVGIGVAIILAFGDREDRPAGMFMGLLAFVVSGVIVAGASRFQRRLQNRLARFDGRPG